MEIIAEVRRDPVVTRLANCCNSDSIEGRTPPAIQSSYGSQRTHLGKRRVAKNSYLTTEDNRTLCLNKLEVFVYISSFELALNVIFFVRIEIFK